MDIKKAYNILWCIEWRGLECLLRKNKTNDVLAMTLY